MIKRIIRQWIRRKYDAELKAAFDRGYGAAVVKSMQTETFAEKLRVAMEGDSVVSEVYANGMVGYLGLVAAALLVDEVGRPVAIKKFSQARAVYPGDRITLIM